MATNIHITKGERENTMSVLRRFRSQVNGWGGLKKVREDFRFFKRSESGYVKKKNRLRAIEVRKNRERLYKLGQIDSISGR